ncbi:hypothetical protein LR48_Vigan2290s000100 [Vigna angularis]|nr:hypothetical protein LR48_Vigan2290s000100 [Vigna angularis]
MRHICSTFVAAVVSFSLVKLWVLCASRSATHPCFAYCNVPDGFVSFIYKSPRRVSAISRLTPRNFNTKVINVRFMVLDEVSWLSNIILHKLMRSLFAYAGASPPWCGGISRSVQSINQREEIYINGGLNGGAAILWFVSGSSYEKTNSLDEGDKARGGGGIRALLRHGLHEVVLL